MAVLGMGKTLVVVVVVLCMMPVRMAIIDLEAILEAVDAVAILIVTVIHLQMLGLWREEALEAEALAPVMVKGAWLNKLPDRAASAGPSSSSSFLWTKVPVTAGNRA